MIDPALPVRFRGSDGEFCPMHGRVRIIGNDGMGHHRVRYHDGTSWKSTRINEHGWSVEVQVMPPVENYTIDWDRPLAFIDTAERGHMSYFPGTEQRYGVSAGDGTVFWYDTNGAAIHKLDQHGNVMSDRRPIMNIETARTRQRDAQVRIIEKKAALARAAAARAQDEAHPLWGQF